MIVLSFKFHWSYLFFPKFHQGWYIKFICVFALRLLNSKKKNSLWVEILYVCQDIIIYYYLWLQVIWVCLAVLFKALICFEWVVYAVWHLCWWLFLIEINTILTILVNFARIQWPLTVQPILLSLPQILTTPKTLQKPFSLKIKHKNTCNPL